MPLRHHRCWPSQTPRRPSLRRRHCPSPRQCRRGPPAAGRCCSHGKGGITCGNLEQATQKQHALLASCTCNSQERQDRLLTCRRRWSSPAENGVTSISSCAWSQPKQKYATCHQCDLQLTCMRKALTTARLAGVQLQRLEQHVHADPLVHAGGHHLQHVVHRLRRLRAAVHQRRLHAVRQVAVSSIRTALFQADQPIWCILRQQSEPAWHGPDSQCRGQPM